MRTVFLVSVTALTLGLPVAAQQAATPPIAAPAATAELKPESLCSIEGKVVNANTGEPLPKAILMMRVAAPPRGNTGIPATFSTTTGADGRFAMTAIEPGSYRLNVTRNGFVGTEYGSRGPMRAGTTLKLEPGQKLSSVDFKLSPHGIISGRIVDEDGEPLAWVQVAPVRSMYRMGKKQLAQYGGASTNDLGEFRMFGIAPGRYLLSATYTQRMMYEVTQDRSAGGESDDSYLPMYYPGSFDPASASAIDIAPGQHISGIEMKLSKTKTTRLRGRVNNMTGVRSQNIMVTISPREGVMYSGGNRSVAQGPEGRFEFRGLAPGSYVVTAFLPDGQSRHMARQNVDIGSEHIDNFVLTVSPGMPILGNLHVEGPSAATFDRTAIRPYLAPMNPDGIMYGYPGSDQVKEDGSFRFANIGADRYTLNLSGMPDGYYVKAIRLGDQPVADDILDFTSGGAPLHVTIGEGAAQVDGLVTNDKQEPVSGATVVLIPVKELRRTRQEFVKIATSDQHGRFTLKNLDPGDYRIYAWEDIENGSWLDPDVIKPVESKGKELTLRERAKEAVELRLIRNE